MTNPKLEVLTPQVAVDTEGNAVHESGPREWRAKIGKIPVVAV